MENGRRTVVKDQVVDRNSIVELRGGGETWCFGENNMYLVAGEWVPSKSRNGPIFERQRVLEERTEGIAVVDSKYEANCGQPIFI